MNNKKMTGGGGATNSINVRQMKKLGLLYFIMLFLCTALICCAFMLPFTPKFVSARTAEANKIEIGELTLEGYDEASENKIFDGNSLGKLYDAILGEEGTGTLEEVEQALKGEDDLYDHVVKGFTANDAAQTVTIPNGISSEVIRSKNGGKDIYVTFGGLRWCVTYITRSNDGHIIVDLWQTQLNVRSAFSGGEGGSAWYATGNGERDNLPCQIYSASLIRSVALNSGSDYNEYYSDDLERQSGTVTGVQDKDSPYSKFTMPKVNGSLTGYLVKPSKVKYQEVESYAGECGQSMKTSIGDTEYYFALPNDAYGIAWKENNYDFYRTEESDMPLRDGEKYVNNGYGGTGENQKDNYSDWQNDYLWLPSLTETGFAGGINGIWNLSDKQRCGVESSWLRSGAQSVAGSAYFLDKDGVAAELGVISNTAEVHGVRPAIHLDLTKAQEAAGIALPTADETAFVYNGNQQTYNPCGYDSDIMNIENNVQIDAGKYSVKVTPKIDYVFANGENEVIFDFEISKAIPIVNPYQAEELPFVTDKIESGVVMLAEGDTDGVLEWGTQVPKAGAYEYEWEFIPTDSKNYESKKGVILLKYREATAVSITANLRNADEEIYSTLGIEELRKKIEVNIVYDSGKEQETTEYVLSVKDGKLCVGENVLNVKTTIEDRTFECRLSIKVLKAEIVNVEYTFAQESAAVYFDTPIDTLKQLKNESGEYALKVYADWNDGTERKPLSTADYELRFETGESFTVGTTSVILSCGSMEKKFNVTVIKKAYDTTNWKIHNLKAVSDGQMHNISFSDIPDSVTPECYLNGKHFEGAVDAGVYEIIVRFINNNLNYNELDDISVTLVIAEKCFALPEVEAIKQYEVGGVDFTPSGVEAYFELVEFFANGQVVDKSYFVQTEIGDYCVTLKFKSELMFFENFNSSVDLKFSITKRVVQAPVFTGKVYYSGNRILPSESDFEGYDASLMQFVKEGMQAGRDAGHYTAKFALKDSAHYMWSAAKSIGSESEINVQWEISRAVIVAERAEGKMPILRSDSYKGNFENIVIYRYFSDADCINEISFDEVLEGKIYFVCAELINTDNFEVAIDSVHVFSEAFSFNAPETNTSLRESVDKLIGENVILFALTCVSLSLVLIISIFLGVVLCLWITRHKRKGVKSADGISEADRP